MLFVITYGIDIICYDLYIAGIKYIITQI